MRNLDERLLLPKNLMAEAFDISVQAFSNWRISPTRKDGREQLYSLPEVIAYRLERDGDVGAGDLNPVQERARLDKARADKAELELGQLKHELFTAVAVESAWADMVGACRSRLLSIPAKLATTLARAMTAQDVEAILRQNIHEALEELAAYDPKHYSAGAGSESTEAHSSAAQPDDQ